MVETPSEMDSSEMGDRFRSIVDKYFVFNLIPPLVLSILAIVVVALTYQNQFDVTLAVAAATLAIIHGLTVYFVYPKHRSKLSVQAINFFACLCYLSLLTISFSLDPATERGRGFALLIFGSSLLFPNKYVFSAFGLISLVTATISFQWLNHDLLVRELFYCCLIPLLLGFFICHSRGALLSHLNNLFEEKKKNREQIQQALSEAQKELQQRIDYEGKLSKANQSFDRLIQVSSHVHWVRKDNEILFISPSYESVWESTCEELYANPNSFLARVHPDDQQGLYAAFQKCFETGKFDEEYRLVMDDGRVKWIHSRSYLDPQDPSTEFGVADDITAKKEIENSILLKNEELQNSLNTLESETRARKKVELENEQYLEKLSGKQRLESLGQLAGGIAHDFNNILMAVLINVDMLRLDIQRGHAPKIDRIEDIEKAALRASEICAQMMQFSGKAPSEVQILELAAQIHDSVRILESSIPSNVSFSFEEPDDKKYVMGGSAQIQQIMLNLITNAKEAVGNSGVIEICLSTEKFNSHELAQAYVELDDFDQEFHVITCRDNGQGMDKKVLERLFEPFYSSKDISRGLGLATVIGIVKGHQGTIMVDSSPNNGTEFKILLPAHNSVSEVESDSPHWASGQYQ